MMLALAAFWSWLKRSWQWVLVGVAILVAFLLGRRRSPVVVVTPDDHRRDIEKETEKRIDEAKEERLEEIDGAKDSHRDQVEELRETQAERTEEIRDDGQKINDFLKQVGKDIQEP